MDIEIKKVRISKSGAKLEYVRVSPADEEGEEDLKVTITEKSNQAPHRDLIGQFNALVPHLVLITESVDGSVTLEKVKEDELLDDYEVRGFTRSGSDENEGIMLIGIKHLRSGKVLNLHTPFMKFTDDYLYMSSLEDAIDNCCSEVVEYINGKKAPSNQLELAFDEEDNE